MITLLAYASLLSLVVPHTFTVALCQVAFAVFVAARLFGGHRIQLTALYWSGLFLCAFFLGVGVAGDIPPFEECLKAANLSMALLVVRPGDAWKLLTAARKFILVSVIFTLVRYFGFASFPMLGHYYPDITLFGRVTNSGLFFEMNYAAMITGLVVLTLRQDWIKIVGLFLINTLYTFRTGFILIPMLLARRLKVSRNGLVWLMAGAAWIMALVFAYNAGPLVLEQRYFIWTAFLEGYQPFEIYGKDEMADIVYYGMVDSPWGPMANLHSGMMEHLAYRGVFSFALMTLAFVVAFCRAKGRDRVPLLYVFCLSFVMSLGLGGLNFLALYGTFLVSGVLVRRRGIFRENRQVPDAALQSVPG